MPSSNLIFALLISALLIFFAFFIPILQKYFVYIHEYGHIIGLLVTSYLTKNNYKKSNIVVFKTSTKVIFSFYNGKTLNNLYKYLEQNKLYIYIRFNAVCGSFFFILCNIITLFLIYSININIIYSIPFIMYIIYESLSFFTSSDFKYFIHPEHFHYTEE